MKITSQERSTGMGAETFSAILEDGKWLRVSRHPRAKYLVRETGYQNYEVEMPEQCISARFYCSNSGRETVEVKKGETHIIQFRSWEAADEWAAAQAVVTVIVTRHAGLIAWLAARGITGDVIAQATPDDVSGKHVIGALPLHLAALADRVTTVDMPSLTAAQRGQDLTPEEMDAAGATLTSYEVSIVSAA